MNILASIVIYTLTILFAPIVLLFYSEFSKALLTFILSLTVLGLFISIPIALMAVRSHRKPQQ